MSKFKNYKKKIAAHFKYASMIYTVPLKEFNIAGIIVAWGTGTFLFVPWLLGMSVKEAIQALGKKGKETLEDKIKSNGNDCILSEKEEHFFQTLNLIPIALGMFADSLLIELPRYALNRLITKILDCCKDEAKDHPVKHVKKRISNQSFDSSAKKIHTSFKAATDKQTPLYNFAYDSDDENDDEYDLSESNDEQNSDLLSHSFDDDGFALINRNHISSPR